MRVGVHVGARNLGETPLVDGLCAPTTEAFRMGEVLQLRLRVLVRERSCRPEGLELLVDNGVRQRMFDRWRQALDRYNRTIVKIRRWFDRTARRRWSKMLEVVGRYAAAASSEPANLVCDELFAVDVGL